MTVDSDARDLLRAANFDHATDYRCRRSADGRVERENGRPRGWVMPDALHRDRQLRPVGREIMRDGDHWPLASGRLGPRGIYPGRVQVGEPLAVRWCVR